MPADWWLRCQRPIAIFWLVPASCWVAFRESGSWRSLRSIRRAEPGDIIDRLTGPWLERTDNDDLRPSPLLSNLGADTRGGDWVIEMHGGIAFTFLKSRSLLASDIFEIATHAMLGQTAKPLIPVMMSLLQAGPQVWEQVVETASILTYFGIGEGQVLPFSDPSDTAAFRVLQLRIAIEAGKQDQVTQIVDQALDEFDQIETSRNPSPGLFELVFLWQLLQRPGDMPLANRLSLSLRFVSVSEQVSSVLHALEERGAIDDSDLQWPDLAAFIPMSLIPAIADVDGLTELLDLIEGLEPDDRSKALGGFASEPEATTLALDRVWLGEAQRSEKRWPELATALQRAIKLSDEMGVPNLTEAAAPLLIRVLDENVGDPDAALAVADAMISEVVRPPRVLAAKARVLWRRKQLPEALELFDEAIPAFTLGLSWRTDVLRDAGVVAGKAEQWPLAVRRLTDALSSMSQDEPRVRRVGFLFDLAIALHLSGRTRDAVNRLGEAMDLLAEDGQTIPPEPLVSVRQLGSQVIKTIGAELGVSGAWGEDEMPLTKLFGSTSALEELTWGNLKPAPLDVILLVMAELDILLPEPPVIAERMAQLLRTSPNLLAQSTQGDMLTRLAVRTLEVSDGAADAMREARAINYGAAERDAGRDVTDGLLEEAPVGPLPRWQELVKYRLLARIVAMIARDRVSDIPVDAWLSAIPTDESMAEVVVMLEDFKRLIAGTEDATGRIMGGNATWDLHLLAALTAPVQKRLSPDQLLVGHVVAARYLYQAKLGEFVALPFSEIITTAWLDRCDSPAQLVAPRVTIAEIRRAVTNSTAGWQRALKVLEAAKSAVSASAGSSVRGYMQALRDQIIPASTSPPPESA